MSEFIRKEPERPTFPKRAVITAGMPYGNKSLHFGHIGGVFIPADFYARFLRDRIGKDNVIFVSGTDCYGSPIEENYRVKCENGEFDGTIEDFVRSNHENQKTTLENYKVSCSLFGASGLGRAKEIHQDVTNEILETLYKNGRLEKRTTKQFFDAKAGKFLNGRQVVGKCPVLNCQSEKGYADECDLGHQYMPENLIDPKSTLTGETPEMKEVSNWYFKLVDFYALLNEYAEQIKSAPTTRKLVYNTIKEFLEQPVIYIKKELYDNYKEIVNTLPEHDIRDVVNAKKTSFAITFEDLHDCDKACEILTNNGFRYRTGKTLVPFRLTGNVKWGVKAPELDEPNDLTIWVWPESLWAPISFTKTYLESIGKDDDEWKKYWCSEDAKIYQFIGSDNIYFYGIAQQAMFMAMQQGDCHLSKDGDLQLSTLVPVNHILFMNKKASSSSAIKPPMAADLLDYYTADQLRSHFLSLGLAMRSVSFMPKVFDPDANENEADPVVKEGNLLTNVFNRMVRSCFYTSQKYFDGILPTGEIDESVLKDTRDAVLKYERHMYKFEFHQVMYVLDSYIRNANKFWSKNITPAEKNDDNDLRAYTLRNMFYMVKVANILLHPLAPEGTDMVREYLGLGDEMWSWDKIFDDIHTYNNITENHKLKFLEPRVDFFAKHPSQLMLSENQQ